MLVPLISFILGLLVLRYAFLAYSGSPLLEQKVPGMLQRTGNGIWLIGCVLVALTLMLGIVGYFSKLNGDWVRSLRILMGGIGLLMLVLGLYNGQSTQKGKSISLQKTALTLGKEFFLIVAIALSFFYLVVPSKTSVRDRHSAPASTHK